MPSLNQLQYFKVLAEEQHLRRTAEKLYISSSSLSITISRLEEEIGVPLFDRTKNQIVLNQYGKAFYKTVSEIFSLLNRGINEVHEMSESSHHALSIAVPNVDLWRTLLQVFISEHPQNKITIYPDNVSVYINNLLGGVIDFVITGTTDITHPKVESEIIGHTKLCVCLSADHPLAERTSLTLQDINGMNYVSLSHDLPFAMFCAKMLKEQNIHLKNVIECDYQMRPELVRTNVGLAITTYEKISLRKYDGTRIIPLVGEGTIRELSLFWRKGRVFSSLDRDFRDWTILQFKNLL